MPARPERTPKPRGYVCPSMRNAGTKACPLSRSLLICGVRSHTLSYVTRLSVCLMYSLRGYSYLSPAFSCLSCCTPRGHTRHREQQAVPRPLSGLHTLYGNATLGVPHSTGDTRSAHALGSPTRLGCLIATSARVVPDTPDLWPWRVVPDTPDLWPWRVVPDTPDFLAPATFDPCCGNAQGGPRGTAPSPSFALWCQPTGPTALLAPSASTATPVLANHWAVRGYLVEGLPSSHR